MIRLAIRLARADLRQAPGRALAVATLLFVAAVLPAILRPGSVPGLVLAAVVAASATAGAAGQQERRARVLLESGAGARAQVLVAAVGLLVPGVVAAVAATLAGVLTDGPPGPLAAGAIAVLVPLVVGAGAAWATAPDASPARRSTAAIAVLIGLTAPLLVVPLVLLAVLVGPRLGRARRPVRVAATVAAVLVTLATTALLSQAETFPDLGILLILTAVPLTIAVGWLGATTVAVVAAGAARLGPTARLATAPLTRRRRQLGPVAAVVTVVVTLAAADGVVGASFEAREADRPPPELLGQAGTTADQAIVVTTGLDPAEVRGRLAEAAGTAPVRTAVIDRVGGGGTEVAPRSEPAAFLDLGAAARVAPATSVPVDEGPSWVGVVAPDALGALGLDAHAAALARGDALVLNPAVVADGGRVTVTGETGAIALPAVPVGGRTGLLLPAVLVSEARAGELGGVRNGARAVVVADPGASADGATSVADALRRQMTDTAGSGPRTVDGLDDTSDFGAIIERQRSVALGDDEVRAPDIAPLDQVPALARTADQGQSRALTFGALAVLVALAGTLLVAGSARSDDAVLLVQGAPARHRTTTAVVQTAVVALAGTLLGALVGLGVPALAFALYNGRGRDPRTLDIPYVLPSSLLVLLAALPLVAAALAAVVVAGRGRPTSRVLADAAA